MKKLLVLVVVCPLLMAIQCEEDYVCGYEDFNGYALSIENPQSTYTINDTIWISGSASSRLIDYCSDSEAPVVVFDSELFRESFFPLQLKNANNTNAEIALTDFDYVIANGTSFDPNACHNSYYVLPDLSASQNEYGFRVGLIPKTAGDFAITSAFISNFEASLNLNLGIFTTYDSFDNEVKFDNCDALYTRRNTDRANFFFEVQ